MRGTALSTVAVLVMCAVTASGGEDDRRDREERALRSLEIRARRLHPPSAADEPGLFLVQETERLTRRARSLTRKSYEKQRVIEALDDLLDAREDLESARRRTAGDDREHERDDTAKRLERTYFRVQQGEYFARLSGDLHASEYVLRARQLYQKARSAYDQGEFRQSAKLASASGELVNVLENLAQAAVRRPEPPVLE
jgi:hypothetical protein